jgi:putative component of membrane protein insertase Oxa1/YidC/SpoIIIJ protein YidD
MMRKSANSSLIIILFLFFCVAAEAQEDMYKSDLVQITRQLSKKASDPFKRPYIYQNETSLLKKLNPIGVIFGSSLYLYQNLLSKHISANCLFTPGCSEFGKEAIAKAGLFTGTLLAIDRLNRCNRIAAQDLRNYSPDVGTRRYPDPVSRHLKTFGKNEE